MTVRPFAARGSSVPHGCHPRADDGSGAPSTSQPDGELLPGMLPASVADQIRKAQVRAALMGQADASLAVGSKCQAVYSADGEYYEATVEAVSEAGNFIVVFEGYGNKEEVGGEVGG